MIPWHPFLIGNYCFPSLLHSFQERQPQHVLHRRGERCEQHRREDRRLSMLNYSHARCRRESVNKISKADVAEIKVVKGSEAYNEALIKEAPQLWHPTTWKLFGCLILGCFAQTMVSHS